MKNVLEVYLSGNTKELDAALSKADKNLQQWGKRLKDVGQSLTLRLTAPLALAGGAAIKMASDFNESLNKVDVAFKGSSQSVKDFAKNSLKQFGIAQGSALDMAALFGDMATSMGLSTSQAAKMSTSLVALAGDMASFKNMNIEEVTTALNGIFTSETESLKRLGIVMTEANVKTYALSQGIKKQYEEMSQAEKTMLRYQYVMSVTTNSQGDFARTGGGAANQMRVFNESLKELGVLFGQTVLPAFTSIVKSLNGVLGYIKDLSPATKTLIMVFGGFATALGPLLYLAGTILPNIVTGFKIATKAATFFQTTLGKSSLIGAAAIALGYLTEKVYEYNKALGDTLELNKEDKKDVSIVKERNELIKQRIDLLQQEYKQAGKVRLQTGFDTSKGLPQSKEQIAKRIAELSKLYKENKAIIGQGNVLAPTTGDANLNVTGESTKDSSAKDYTQELAQARLDLKNATFELNQEELKLAKTQSLIKFGDLSKTLPQLSNNLSSYFDKFPQYGEKVMGVVQKMSTMKSPFQLMNEQVIASTTIIQEQLDLQAENFNIYMQNVEMLKNATQSFFASMGQSIVDSFGLAKTGLEGFLGSLANVLVQMGAMAIAESILGKKKVATNLATSYSNAVTVGTNAAAASGPAGLVTIAPFIAAAMGAVKGAFSTIPAFASGGIVSGPTMGLMGEYPGAKSNPEVIAPLNKLQNMLDNGGGNNVNVSGEFVVRGQDLILALQRAEKQKQRIG
jgi:hypothetical protein